MEIVTYTFIYLSFRNFIPNISLQLILVNNTNQHKYNVLRNCKIFYFILIKISVCYQNEVVFRHHMKKKDGLEVNIIQGRNQKGFPVQGGKARKREVKIKTGFLLYFLCHVFLDILILVAVDNNLFINIIPTKKNYYLFIVLSQFLILCKSIIYY